jgi:hypothetical protein
VLLGRVEPQAARDVQALHRPGGERQEGDDALHRQRELDAVAAGAQVEAPEKLDPDGLLRTPLGCSRQLSQPAPPAWRKHRHALPNQG